MQDNVVRPGLGLVWLIKISMVSIKFVCPRIAYDQQNLKQTILRIQPRFVLVDTQWSLTFILQL